MPNALDPVADRKPAIGLAKVEHKKHSGIQRTQREQRREKCAEQTGAPAAKQAAPVQDDSGHQDDEVDDEKDLDKKPRAYRDAVKRITARKAKKNKKEHFLTSARDLELDGVDILFDKIMADTE